MTMTESTTDREIELSRAYDAPRDLVFKVWTDPQHMPHWWGPRGFTITMLESESRPGGRCRFIMHAPDGTDYSNRFVYREYVAPERLVYDHSSDIDNDPATFLVTVTFEERGNQTVVTMRSLFPTAEHRAGVVAFGAIELGRQTMDKCAEYLAANQGQL